MKPWMWSSSVQLCRRRLPSDSRAPCPSPPPTLTPLLLPSSFLSLVASIHFHPHVAGIQQSIFSRMPALTSSLPLHSHHHHHHPDGISANSGGFQSPFHSLSLCSLYVSSASSSLTPPHSPSNSLSETPPSSCIASESPNDTTDRVGRSHRLRYRPPPLCILISIIIIILLRHFKKVGSSSAVTRLSILVLLLELPSRRAFLCRAGKATPHVHSTRESTGLDVPSDNRRRRPRPTETTPPRSGSNRPPHTHSLSTLLNKPPSS